MMTSFITKYFKVVLIVLCFVTLLPYFLACRYVHPFFDDYYFADQISYYGPVNFIQHFYSNWSGRYSEVILMVCSNVKIENASNLQYALFAVFTLISILISLFYLVHVLAGTSFSFLRKWIITLMILVFYFVFMPELFTAFYWHCSSYYQLCLSFLLLNIGMLINVLKEEKGWGYKTGLLILNIFIAGFSEVTIFSFGVLYGCIVLHHYFKYKKIKTFWLVLLLVFSVCALANICSPGNMVRMGVSASRSEVQHGLLFCGLRAIYDLVLFHGYYTFFKTPFLFVCLLFLPYAIKFVRSGNPTTRILNVNPVFSILVTLFIFYMHHVLTLVAAGYSLQGRVLNFSIFLFWLAIVYNLLVVLNRVSEKVLFFDVSARPGAFKALMIVIILLFNLSDNNRLLWGDLVRELPAFQKQLTERYELVENAKKNGAQEVEVPFVKAIPKLYIFGEEARCRSSSFANEPKYLGEAEQYFKIHIKE
jgi:hypothetical protein